MIQTTENRVAPIAAIILAAGGSRRMGQPKQLLPLAGEPMVRRVAKIVCATQLAQVVVVVGAKGHAVTEALGQLPIDIVHNPQWDQGMSTSVQAGLKSLQPDIQAALLVLGDQPAITSEILQMLIDRHILTGAPLVVPFYQGRRGNPVLFARTLFPEIASVHGDKGGRDVIARYHQQMERVDIDDAAITFDVDTIQDYQKIQGLEDGA